MTPGCTVAAVVPPAPDTPLRRLDIDALGDHLDRLFRAAWALSGNREDAEDLVQETYARVLARPRWLRNEDDLAYLLRALRNVHVSRLRHAGRRIATLAFDELRAEPATTRAAWLPESAADAGELFAAIAALPAHAREAVVAVDVVGLTYAEAARALRVREATLTSRLHRGRRRLVGAFAPDAGPRTAPEQSVSASRRASTS